MQERSSVSRCSGRVLDDRGQQAASASPIAGPSTQAGRHEVVAAHRQIGQRHRPIPLLLDERLEALARLRPARRGAGTPRPMRSQRRSASRSVVLAPDAREEHTRGVLRGLTILRVGVLRTSSTTVATVSLS